jgi:ElaB/YqjD/DUF883 family membrane-anchored ribosome-binding protein
MSDRTSGAREASYGVKEAVKDAAHDVNKATSKTQEEIAADLQSLQHDMAKLAEQVASVLASKGGAAYRAARAGVDGVISDVGAKGQEAKDAVSEVADNFTDAIDESLAHRPYMTLAIALGIGFLFGATWRR